MNNHYKPNGDPENISGMIGTGLLVLAGLAAFIALAGYGVWCILEKLL